MKKLLFVLFVILAFTGLKAQTRLNEGFEGTLFPPLNWSSHDVSGTTSAWIRATGTGANASAAYARLNAEPLPTGGNDWLISPKLTVATIDSLTFWIRRSATSTGADTTYVLISTTDNQIASFTTILATFIGSTAYNSNTWVQKIVQLSAYAGQNIYIAFKHVDVAGMGIRFDDVTGPIVYQAANDLSVVSLLVPNKGVLHPGNTGLRAVIKNAGLNPQTAGKTISFYNGTQLIGSSVTTLALTSNQTDTVNFAWTQPATSTNHLSAMCATDDDNTNNTANFTAYVYDADYIFESFEGIIFPPTNWTAATWTRATTLGNSYQGTAYANLGTSLNAMLVSPKLDVVAGDSIAFYAAPSGTGVATIKIQYSLDKTTWTTIDSITLTNAYNRYVAHINVTGHYYFAFNGTVAGAGGTTQRLDLIAMPPEFMLNNDLAVTSLIVPQKGTLNQGTYTLKAVVKNIGINTQTVGQVVTFKNGSTILGTGTTTLSLATNAIDTVSFSWNANTTSTFALNASVANDDDNLNNIVNVTAYVYDADYSIQTFEATTWPPAGWVATSWTAGTILANIFEGSRYANCATTNGRLTTPKLAVTSGDSIAFYAAATFTTNAPTVTVQYSTDNVTWTTLGTAITLSATYSRYVANITLTGNYYFSFLATIGVGGFGTSERIDLVAMPPNYVLPANDLSVISLVAPQKGTLLQGTHILKAVVKNIGTGSQAAGQVVTFSDGANTIGTATTSVALAQNDTNTVTVNWTAIATSTYHLTAAVATDEDNTNNTANFTAYVYDADYTIQSFEPTTWPPAGWTATTWARNATAINAFEGSAYANLGVATNARLATPKLDVISGDSIAFYARASATTMNVKVQYSLDKIAWTTIDSIMLTTAYTRYVAHINITGHYFFAFTGTVAGGGGSSERLDLIAMPPEFVLNNDLAVTALVVPHKGTLLQGTYPLKAVVKNIGINTQPIGKIVTFKNGTAILGTATTTISLATNAVDTVVFNWNANITSTYHLNASVVSDDDVTNNIANAISYIYDADYQIESFEGTTFPPVGWSAPGTTPIWGVGTTAGAAYEGVRYAGCVSGGTNVQMVTQLLTVASGDSIAYYSYSAATTNNPTVTIEYSTDAITWNELTPAITLTPAYTRYVSNITTAGDYYFAFTTTNNSGSSARMDLIAYPPKFTVQYDAGVLSYTHPNIASSCGFTNAEPVSIWVKNFGAQALSNLSVAYTVDGGTPIVENITSTIASGDSVNFNFNTLADLSAVGTHSIKAYTMLSGDALAINDTNIIDVMQTASSTVPYNMGFETTEDYAGWTINDVNSDAITWSRVATTTHANSGGGAVRCPVSTTVPNDDWYITKCIDLAQGTQYVLNFYYKARFLTTVNTQNMNVFIGNQPVPAALTTPIVDLNAFDTINYVLSSTLFTVPASGVYYAGFHNYSLPNAATSYIYMDDFSITECALTSVFNTTDASCNGAADGSADITTSGGTGNYTYLWSDGSTNATLSNVVAGWYHVTTTDVSGCTRTDSVQVLEPVAIDANLDIIQITCNGAADGVVTANPTGGSGNFTYVWTGFGFGQSISNLDAGTFYVTIYDGLTCQKVDSAVIVDPAPIVATASVVNVLCNGASTGAVNVTISGGTTPYLFAWSDGSSTQNLINVPAGAYDAAITDAHDCQSSTSATVTEPSAIVTAGVVTNATCGNNDGGIVFTATGGVPSYIYNWSNGANTQSLSNIGVGIYTITVTDANDCNALDTFAVINPNAPVVSTAVTHVTCNGQATGLINLNVVGGASVNTTFLWSNGAVTQNLSNVVAGTYSVTVTDNNCSTVSIATINQPSPIVLDFTKTDILCFGNNNGSVMVNVTGGTPGYSYFWSNGPSSASINNLGAGTYAITVADANGCNATGSVALVNPIAIVIDHTAVNPTCNGSSNGNISLMVTGGTGVYTYLWSNSATSQNLINIGAGTYGVTVKDANNCTATLSVDITEPAILTLSTVVTDIACFGANTGAINLTVTGGTYPYAYMWSSISTTQDVFQLAAGIYSVTVTDMAGCVKSISATINQANEIIVTNVVTNVACFGASTGAIDLTITGGTPNYIYAWSNQAFSQDLTNIAAGAYTVSVTDAQGCMISSSVSVTEPAAALLVSAVATDVFCNGGATGMVSLTVTGGTTAYSFLWSNGAISHNLSGVPAGNYAVTVTDAHGCTANTSAIVNEPATVFSIIATPLNSTCMGGNFGGVTLTLNGGVPVVTYIWNTGATTQSISNIFAGTYSVTATDANGCIAHASAIVGEPSVAFTATTVVSDALCFGGNSGNVEITLTNGAPSFTYHFSTGATITNSLTVMNVGNLVAGAYSLTVTDNLGCVAFANAVINEPTQISITPIVTGATCGQNDGSIVLTVSGGTLGYTYLWNTVPVQNLATASALAAGNYMVTVTDANLCTTTNTYAVSNLNAATVTTVVTDVNCFGGADGVVNITPTGGSIPYTFLWSNNEITEDISSLPAGNYTVTVTDNINCLTIVNTVVVQPQILSGTANVTDALCHGGSTGAIDITPTGGTPPYTFAWSNGAQTEDIANVTTGNYTISATDAHGCTANFTIPVGEASSLAVNFTVTPDDGACTGTIIANATGGTPSYNYTWNNSATGASLNGLCAGTYTVTVTDANGCIISNFTDVVIVGVNLVSMKQIEIYPNPSTGRIMISNVENTSIFVYNMQGKLLSTTENTKATQQLDLSGYADGIYFVRVISGKDNYVTKIVIQK